LAPTTATTPNNTQTIAKNSFWYGLEMVFGVVSALLSSILVARVIGPTRLGYFNYVVWMTNVTNAVGGFGLPMTVRKYMAERLNAGQPGVARSIYRFALRAQMLIAASVVALGVLLVYTSGDLEYRTISILLVLNLAPRMIGLVPSQANNAAEMMKRNTTPSLCGGTVTVVLTLYSLWAGWGLLGVAWSSLIGSVLETVWKVRTVALWLNRAPAEEMPRELRRRMLSYSGQGFTLMILNILVWDRSDLFILKKIHPDIRQVAFFSVAFNLTERVMMFPNAFGNSLGVTMMAQYGRGQERVLKMAVLGAKYAFMIALPLLAGMACVSGPLVNLLYGADYLPLIPVLTIAALLAIPKALIAPPTALLQTTENQGYLIWIGCICGALDIALDFALIPRYGAVGAAIANGTAQTAAALALWWRVYRLFGSDLDLRVFGRIAVSGLGMAAAAWWVAHQLPGYAGMAAAILAGAAIWLALLRLTAALDASDRERLGHISRVLPARVRPAVQRALALLTPAG
jgi:O-antigen/teichoic acid export membrane protein